MKQKIIGIMSLMTVMLFAFATTALAGDFLIQSPVGTNIFTVDTSGNVNASGTIMESNVLLSNTYWAIVDVATPNDADTTHLSTADQIYDWVIGLNYITADAELNLIDTYIFVGNGTGKAVGVVVSGDITIDNTGVVSVVNTQGLSASNITSGTIDNARINLGQDDIPTLSSTWANEMDADNLVGLDFLNDLITIQGENITGGIVAAARIDSAMATDAEVAAFEYFDDIANFTGTLSSSKWCLYDGSDIVCNTEPVTDTTYTADAPLNLTGTVFGLIDCGDTEIYKFNATSEDWECEADGGGMDDLIDDVTPTLGGPLDMNGFSIEEPGSTNMTIDVSGNFIIVLS